MKAYAQNAAAVLLLTAIVLAAFAWASDSWRALRRPAPTPPLAYETMTAAEKALADSCAEIVYQEARAKDSAPAAWQSAPCSDLPPGSAIIVYRRVNDLIARDTIGRTLRDQ